MSNIDFTHVATVEARQFKAKALYLDQVILTIDAHVEDTARQRGYTSAAHIASYVTSTITQWAAEAMAFVTWRDAIWVYALTRLDGLQGTAASYPPPQAFLADAPDIDWP
jgi:hypothetical protein